MQMCHEGCQSVKENLLPVSDAQDKQLQEMNNGTGKRNLPGWHPREVPACGGAVYLNPTVCPLSCLLIPCNDRLGHLFYSPYAYILI